MASGWRIVGSKYPATCAVFVAVVSRLLDGIESMESEHFKDS